MKIKETYQKEDSRSAAMQDSHWQASADASKWPAYQLFPASAWNYGLEGEHLTNDNLSQYFTVMRKTWPANDFPFTEDDVPVTIETKGKQIPAWGIDKYGLCDTLPQSPVTTSGKEENIELIPMGAARLRISAFPVVR